jgi:hypothetical protein
MTVIELTPGVHFSYTDSGPPPSEDVYTTLLVIHGYGWNASQCMQARYQHGWGAYLLLPDTFQRVIDLAPKHGVRVITFHRRDYGDSTPFTDAEIAPIKQAIPEPGAIDAFMTARTLELANFVSHVVESKEAVAPRDGKGGIALLGWSLGNLYGLDFLSRFHGLPDRLKAPMKAFVRSFVVFGKASLPYPGYSANGCPDAPIEGVAIPPPTPAHAMYALVVFNRHLAQAGVDPAAANPAELAAAGDALADWTTGWCEYTDADRAAADPVERYVAPNERPPARASTRVREAGNPAFGACAEAGPVSNENAVLGSLLPAVAAAKAFDPLLFEDPARTLWEGMRVEMAYAANSLWTCVYTADVLRAGFERAVPGRRVREIPAANHFVSGLPSAREKRHADLWLPLLGTMGGPGEVPGTYHAAPLNADYGLSRSEYCTIDMSNCLQSSSIQNPSRSLNLFRNVGGGSTAAAILFSHSVLEDANQAAYRSRLDRQHSLS